MIKGESKEPNAKKCLKHWGLAAFQQHVYAIYPGKLTFAFRFLFVVTLETKTKYSRGLKI